MTLARSCRGCAPIANRTPNSRVRALTENANTRGNANERDRQSNGRKDTEHYGVETIRGENFGANVFERGGTLNGLVDRHIPNDPRHRRDQ